MRCLGIRWEKMPRHAVGGDAVGWDAMRRNTIRWAGMGRDGRGCDAGGIGCDEPPSGEVSEFLCELTSADEVGVVCNQWVNPRSCEQITL